MADAAPPEDKKGDKKEKKGKEVGSIKPGSYSVHILIETAKEIMVPEGETADVMVECTCGKEKKFTPVQNNVTSTSNVSF